MEYTTDESSILGALSALQKNDTQLVSEATNFLLQAMESQYNLETFISILCNPYPPYVGFVTKSSLERRDKYAQSWYVRCSSNIIRISTYSLEWKVWLLYSLWYVVKQISLSLLSTETNHGIRRAICGMISVIAMYEYMGGEWTEVKDIVFSVFCFSFSFTIRGCKMKTVIFGRVFTFSFSLLEAFPIVFSPNKNYPTPLWQAWRIHPMMYCLWQSRRFVKL